MPQLDVSTYSSQLFWLALLFSFLFMMVHFYFAPKMKKIFRMRDLKFRKMIALSKQLKKEIEKMEEKIAQKEGYAHDHIRSIVHEAEIQSQREIFDHKHALSVVNHRLLKDFESELEEMQQGFLTSSKEEEDLTRLLLDKILGFPLSKNVYKEALNRKDRYSHVA
ncbi:MAG: hypothetical protein FJX18_07175 [Alphaproteobacteria bacterium]|nr:hypothetical protein [Alphaproteobacteria bacterium]